MQIAADGTTRLAWATAAACLLSGCPLTVDFEVDPAIDAGPVEGGSHRTTVPARERDGGATSTGNASSNTPACPDACSAGCEQGTCRIECLSEQECKEDDLRCPAGFDCQIRCAGKQSCEKATIVCSDDTDCAIECLPEQGCKGAEIICGNGPCQLSCRGPQACQDVQLICSTHSCTARCSGGDDVKGPELDCGGSEQCIGCDDD